LGVEVRQDVLGAILQALSAAILNGPDALDLALGQPSAPHAQGSKR
jgi:hypothetical protein